MIAGSIPGPIPDDDLRYVVDLGLVRITRDGGLRIANPMYHEVVPRALAMSSQRSMPTLTPSWLVASHRPAFATASASTR